KALVTRGIAEDGGAAIDRGQDVSRHVVERDHMSAWSGQPQLSGETFGPAVDATHENERRIVGQVGRQQLVGRAQPWQVLARVDGADIEDVALGKTVLLADSRDLFRRSRREDGVGAEGDIAD